jgi:predicted lipid-binding transport protein (Tim44 family)
VGLLPPISYTIANDGVNMKKLLGLVAMLFTVSTLFMLDAEAKRLGGGMSLGKQYSSSPSAAKKPTQGAAAAPNAAANSGRASGASRWLGPLAGLAAGGLLASMLFGDGFEGLQIMDILLFAGLIFGGIMLFKMMRKRSQPAAAGAYGGANMPYESPDNANYREAAGGAQMGGEVSESPAWFDGSSFAEGAKTHFVRLQAAWDKGDFRDIRDYTSPELFAELKRERDKLGEESHYTEVVTLNAQLLETRREGDQLVASVHFTGLVREEEGASANALSEIWHVVHDWDAPQGDWLIAGIQQVD